MNKDGIYLQRKPPFCQYEAEIFSQLSLIVIPNSSFCSQLSYVGKFPEEDIFYLG